MSLQCAGGSYPLLNFLGSGNLALLDLEMANCRGSRLANGLTGRAVLAGVSVSLVANGVQFMNNSAETNFTVDYACGGAVRADGPSAFANCTFAHNSITVHPPAISGRGGALCTGSVTAVTNCTFFYNSVGMASTAAEVLQDGEGGAFYWPSILYKREPSDLVQLAFIDCNFTANAIGGTGGQATGGAVSLSSAGIYGRPSVSFDNCTFASNTAAGSNFSSSEVSKPPGDAGGGAIAVVPATVQESSSVAYLRGCTFVSNVARAGHAGWGGLGNGGAGTFAQTALRIESCVFAGNQAYGGRRESQDEGTEEDRGDAAHLARVPAKVTEK